METLFNLYGNLLRVLPDAPTRGVRGMDNVIGFNRPMAPKIIPAKYTTATLELERYPASEHSKHNPSTNWPITLPMRCQISL